MSFLSSCDSAFVPSLGPAPLIPSKAIVCPVPVSQLHGRKCGLCSAETFIQVLPWWGRAGSELGGAPRRTQSLAAEGQGQPLSPSLRLAWVAQSAQKSSCSGQITLCWGRERNYGQTVSASLFAKKLPLLTFPADHPINQMQQRGLVKTCL